MCPPPSAFDLQTHLAEQPLTGWFYSRLATRIAERSGDRPLLATIEASSQHRAAALLWRSRAFAALESALMVVGLLVLVWWVRRGTRTEMFRVGSAELPPLWAGRLGAGVLLRGGAVGALLTVAFLYAALDYPSLRVLAVPLSNLPLLALAYYHLLRPQRQTFWSGFGLRIEPRHLGQLGFAVLAVVAAGLVGEWVMGRIAEPLEPGQPLDRMVRCRFGVGCSADSRCQSDGICALRAGLRRIGVSRLVVRRSSTPLSMVACCHAERGAIRARAWLWVDRLPQRLLERSDMGLGL